MTNPTRDSSLPHDLLNDFLQVLLSLAGPGEGLPDPSSEAGRTTLDFFENNWQNARSGLLAKTHRIQVSALPGPAPTRFRFSMDLPYKRIRDDGSVDLAPGPVRGTIHYRPDILNPEPGGLPVIVFLDSDLGFFHPNYSRKHGVLCIGDIPRFPLDALLQHVYGIVSYQNRDSTNPADMEAVRYFADNPGAMSGVENVPKLF